MLISGDSVPQMEIRRLLDQKIYLLVTPTHLFFDRWPMGCLQVQGTPFLVVLFNDEDMIELAKADSYQDHGMKQGRNHLGN